MRRFELADKYWCIRQEDCNVRLVWGVADGKEQRHDRTLASPEAAAAYLEMQIATQRERGYVEAVLQAHPPPERRAATIEPVDERPVARSIRFELAGETRTEFRRYPRPAQFTEIEQRDRLLIEWTGHIERPDDRETSKRTEETFPTIALASDAYDEAVQAAREDNWRQVRSSKVQVAHNHAALEAQCLADDADPVPWGVFADWLIAQGDPLGEIAARSSDTDALALISGELAELGVDAEVLEIGRVHGFPRRVTIRQLGEELDEADPSVLAATTRAVLASGPFRFVDSLQFGLAGYTDRNDWSHTLRVIAESTQVARLRELRFNAYSYEDCEISWATFGDFSGLLSRLPALELLHLKSGAGGTLGDIDLPSLRTFIRESGGLAASEIEAICNARWPKLEHLEIWFGSGNYGAQGSVATIRAILDGKGLPRLGHLGLVNCEFVEDAVESLVHSKILPRLHSLDLSKGILARRGVAAFEQHAAAFRHLASIDLSENLLEDEEAARIRAVLDNVILADQREREIEDYEEEEADGEISRYVAIGE